MVLAASAPCRDCPKCSSLSQARARLPRLGPTKHRSLLWATTYPSLLPMLPIPRSCLQCQLYRVLCLYLFIYHVDKQKEETNILSEGRQQQQACSKCKNTICPRYCPALQNANLLAHCTRRYPRTLPTTSSSCLQEEPHSSNLLCNAPWVNLFKKALAGGLFT